MLYLKRAPYITLLSLSLLSASSYAEQNYQTELSGIFVKEDADTSKDETTGLLAEIYFSPVNTDNKPLAQAAYLDKSSSVALGYIKQKTDVQNTNYNSIDIKGPLVVINYITETNSFILGALYSKSDFNTDNNLATGDSTAIGINIGKYLNDESTIEFSYVSNETEARNASSGQASSNDADSYNLTYETVRSLDSSSYYRFGAGISLIKRQSNSVKEDNHGLGILGEYYFTRMTSIGAIASFNSGDDVSREGKTFGFGVTHFFAPQFALNMELEKFNADDSQTEDSDSVLFEVIARF